MSSKCKHELSSSKEWLPSDNGILKLHPYCRICGVVKNVSADKGKKLGYFVNILSALKRDLEKRGYKISQTQIRLILNELKKKILKMFMPFHSPNREIYF